MPTAQGLEHLSAREPHSGLVRVIVDTPKGSRNKYKYDEHLHMYRLSKGSCTSSLRLIPAVGKPGKIRDYSKDAGLWYGRRGAVIV
jgi:hypothetical protein